MAFDQSTRNRLARFVSDARRILTNEFMRQCKQDYGIDPDTGEVSDVARLTHLNDTQRATAHILRETLSHYVAGSPTGGTRTAVDRIVREQAFTVLNRLCALRMAEARGILIESIGRGYQSKGFQLYARIAGSSLGETGDAYRCYLFSVFDDLSLDLAALFDRFCSQGRLFPSEPTLLSVLAEINHGDIEPLWLEDETIGWLYQYFNSQEERRQMRDDSPAPRDSRELAVRNQFFTPRYVVEFLTDNTLGRLWYEMTKGTTSLTHRCRHLVRRDGERFLGPGDTATKKQHTAGLTTKQLIDAPVDINHRPLKDPRDIRMLDPACGSMHFGLYAFDLLEQIYAEAWDLEVESLADGVARTAGMRSLHNTYDSKASFLRDVPRLIIECNIHGIDIDPRAAQIACLSLWLRAQRSWHSQQIKPQDRPRIRRSNVVCAEPMPGETRLLEEFITTELAATPEQQVLGQLVRRIFGAMALAGEAGSLLKIEQAIADAVQEAKKQWLAAPLQRQSHLFNDGASTATQQTSGWDVRGVTDSSFWEKAEGLIYAALQAYAERTETGVGIQRRLFVDDAARGFAFIDVCRKRFDVVLMNPPFGLAPIKAFEYARKEYPSSYTELLATFVERAVLLSEGFVGAITSRAFMVATRLKTWREECVVSRLSLLGDLGSNVMDAALVEAAAFVLAVPRSTAFIALDVRSRSDRADALARWRLLRDANGMYCISPESFLRLPQCRILYSLDPSVMHLATRSEPFEPRIGTARQGLATWDDFRFIRLWWEVPAASIGSGRKWEYLSKGGAFSRYAPNVHLLMKWNRTGSESCAINIAKNGSDAQARQASDYWRRPGLTYSIRSSRGFSARLLPAGCLFTGQGPLIASESRFSNLYLLGWINSALIRYLVELQSNAGKYMSGIIKTLPWIDPPREGAGRVEALVTQVLASAHRVAMADETSPYFATMPHGSHVNTVDAVLQDLQARQDKYTSDVLVADAHTDRFIRELYGISEEAVSGLRAAARSGLESEGEEAEEDEESAEDSSLTARESHRDVCERLLSYLIGCAFGRWVVEPSTLEGRLTAEAPLFDPLPSTPPGAIPLQGKGCSHDAIDESMRGSAAGVGIENVAGDVLVDDPSDARDIVQRVRNVMNVLWHRAAEGMERELCHGLGAADMRSLIQTELFSSHLQRYSKSRRQAPIYWPLATASGEYTLWVYYHCITDQTLFLCVNNFVEPKLAQVCQAISRARGRTTRSSAEDKELERLIQTELELREFRDELLRVAKFWKPNHDDGVQITASPLWKLFRHKAWQKTLRATWEALEAGEYDWASLAYGIWPDRVREVCKSDKSVALAHGLEDLYCGPPPAAARKRSSKPKTNGSNLLESAE
jgi:hypothetical protein